MLFNKIHASGLFWFYVFEYEGIRVSREITEFGIRRPEFRFYLCYHCDLRHILELLLTFFNLYDEGIT